jgi:hypothetical protein
MKITKSKILLIKLAVLCAMTFGLFYAKPAQVDGAGMCSTCYNNCQADFTACENGFLCQWLEACSHCNTEHTGCIRNCNDIVCTPIATEQSGV